MDQILKQSLLYDFYGELLNEHQKEIYEQVVTEDLSLSEVALNAGITRQGVHDIIRRCNRSLEGYEDKLHLVERFIRIREQVEEISELLSELEDRDSDTVERIRKISRDIIEEL